jgi:4-hydroxy-tetrahydrodipicolinate synthase
MSYVEKTIFLCIGVMTMASTLRIPDGVWPVMVTPFRADGAIDWEALPAVVDWYVDAGVTGLFAVCLSSEMYELSPMERLELARAVVTHAAGRVPVVATGTQGASQAERIEGTLAMAATGVAGVVAIVNAFAAPDESESVWRANVEELLARTPGIPLGLYECPIPDWRLLATDSLAWAASTGRFEFMKDTCCDIGRIEARLAAVAGTPLRLFNANLSTLLPSLQLGAAGFSGTVANFCPELPVWLVAHHRREPVLAARLQRWLTIMMRGGRTNYLAIAKTFMAMRGVPIGPTLRRAVGTPLNAEDHRELAALAGAVADWRADLGLAPLSLHAASPSTLAASSPCP